MQLKDIHSQNIAVSQLQHAFAAGRTAHAYLFVGPDGVGKRTTARAFAKMLLCHDRAKKQVNGEAFFDSCGKCHSCTLFEADSHPDYKPIYKELVKYTKEGKNKTTPIEMPVDVIREFVIDKVSNRPAESDFVVYVIDEAEKVNKSSQNSMLKVLEEPPGYCVLILLCSRIEEMLPTTRSRCQPIRFGPVEESFLLEKLNPLSLNAGQALYWARFSEGSVGRALEWAGLDLGEESPTVYEIKNELLRRICRLSLPEVPDTAAWIGQSAKIIGAAWARACPEMSTKDLNRRAQKGMIRMVLCLLSDVMNAHLGRPSKWVNADQESAVRKLAETMDCEQAAEKILAVQNMLRWVDASVNEKLIFEHLLFMLSLSDILNVSPV